MLTFCMHSYMPKLLAKLSYSQTKFLDLYCKVRNIGVDKSILYREFMFFSRLLL